MSRDRTALRARRPAGRRRLAATAAALAVGLAAGLGVHAGTTGVQLTDAAWVDREDVGGALGTRATWCDTGLYSTTGRGQLLAGVVGTGSTSTVTAVDPLRVTNPGSGPSTTRAGAVSAGAGTDALVAPLTAAALQGTQSTLGSSVSFGSGLVAAHLQQHARATSTGAGAGAAGAVSATGTVDAATQTTTGGLPDLATVDVRALVGGPLLSSTLGAANAADLTTLTLVAGTTASSTVRDACISNPTTTRAYGVSGLRLEATSTSLRAASTQAKAAASAAQTAITSTSTTTASVRGAVAANVNTVYRTNQALLNLLTPGTSTPAMTMSLTVDLPAAVAAQTSQTLGAGGPVRLDLATGVMTVDVAALTSTTAGINGLAPNTEVLSAAIMSAASTSVGTLLPAYRTAVLGSISTALSTSVATISVSTPITLLGLVSEPSVVTYVGTLNQLRDKQGTVTATVGANNTCGLVTAGSCASVRNALNSTGGTAQLRQAAADAVTSTVYGTSTTGTVPPSGQVVAAVAAAQGRLQSSLAALPSAVSAQVNVRPDVTTPAARPGVAFAAGEVGVTALRVGAVPAARTAWLALGTSAAGPNIYRPVGSAP